MLRTPILVQEFASVVQLEGLQMRYEMPVLSAAPGMRRPMGRHVLLAPLALPLTRPRQTVYHAVAAATQWRELYYARRVPSASLLLKALN